MNHSLAQPRSHGHMQPPRKGGRRPLLATRCISTKTHPGPPPVVQIQHPALKHRSRTRTRIQNGCATTPHANGRAPRATAPSALRTACTRPLRCPHQPSNADRKPTGHRAHMKSPQPEGAPTRERRRRRLNAAPHGCTGAPLASTRHHAAAGRDARVRRPRSAPRTWLPFAPPRPNAAPAPPRHGAAGRESRTMGAFRICRDPASGADTSSGLSPQQNRSRTSTKTDLREEGT